MSSNNKNKLTYFHAMGLAEPLRYLLSYGNIDFEDNRVNYETFHEIKPSMPFGQVPVLEYEGEKLFQSIAICRFLANKLNLCGLDAESALECDMIVDTITDLRMHFRDAHFTPDKNLKEQKKEKLIKETIPFYLSGFQTIVEKNDGYFVGGNLTWADLYFVGILCFMESFLKMDMLKEYPSLQQLREKVNNLPMVKKWIDTRPVTEL